jgi:hypothetical protein
MATTVLAVLGALTLVRYFDRVARAALACPCGKPDCTVDHPELD